MGHHTSGTAAARAPQPGPQTPGGNVTSIGDRKRDRGDRPQLYSRKAKYKGPTATLTLYVKEQKGGRFVVHALLVKTDDTKQKGVVNEFPNREAANQKFDEFAQKCVANGWTLATTVTKSAFDDIPQAI